jgi:hypothetical protein
MAAVIASLGFVVPDELKPYFKPAFDKVELKPLLPDTIA